MSHCNRQQVFRGKQMGHRNRQQVFRDRQIGRRNRQMGRRGQRMGSVTVFLIAWVFQAYTTNAA